MAIATFKQTQIVMANTLIIMMYFYKTHGLDNVFGIHLHKDIPVGGMRMRVLDMTNMIAICHLVKKPGNF